jgi:hypothetical protein
MSNKKKKNTQLQMVSVPIKRYAYLQELKKHFSKKNHKHNILLLNVQEDIVISSTKERRSILEKFNKEYLTEIYSFEPTAIHKK